ncbi:MAG: Bpu10I family restriction endonuclease [Kiritimatiellae bacterium]|nr:Bpu10I family restriction endonuclease [Kiritimatiellia bacterium]
MDNDIYKYIEHLVEDNSFLVHAKNILTRKSRNDNVAKLDLIARKYIEYYSANLEKGFNESIIKKRVIALNRYYNYIHEEGYDNLYSAQTKFRPTILEEFMAILFRDLVEDVATNISDCKLDLGAIKAYTNLFFYGQDFISFVENPTIGLNLKDQDFAVYRTVDIKVDDNDSVKACLPIVAVECKTYVDKTMLEGSVATADKIKVGNPYSLFCIISEFYDVSINVDPAYSRIDQIYILRKSRRKDSWKEIDADVVLDFVDFVKKHLTRPWSNIEKKLVETGKII